MQASWLGGSPWFRLHLRIRVESLYKAETQHPRVKLLTRGDVKLIALATSITILLSALAAVTPFENALSYYAPYPPYPWLPYWRVATAMFFAWIASASIASRERALFVWLSLTSATAMAAAHYSSLAIASASRGLEVALYPLFYTVRHAGGKTLHLDLAQIVLVVTAAELYFILRRPPRTASGEKQTPSRLRRA